MLELIVGSKTMVSKYRWDRYIDKESLYGGQIGYHNDIDVLNGLQAGIVNSCDECYGVQVGGSNATLEDSTCGQIGMMNISLRGRLSGVQLGIANNVGMILNGGQAGVVNNAELTNGCQVGGWNDSEEINGLQVGLYNKSYFTNGVQIGVVCCAEEGNFVQFGLLTIRRGEEPWYRRVTPIFGYHRG